MASLPRRQYRHQNGIEIIRRAFKELLRQIVNNAGLEGSVIVNQVKSGSDYGFNAATEVYENLLHPVTTDSMPLRVPR